MMMMMYQMPPTDYKKAGNCCHMIRTYFGDYFDECLLAVDGFVNCLCYAWQFFLHFGLQFLWLLPSGKVSSHYVTVLCVSP